MVSFLDKLLGRSSEQGVLWLYVRCGNCGAEVRVRINLYNDLSVADDGGHILRKEIMDSRCCQLMHAVLHFDGKRRVISRDITGGDFISQDEFEAAEPS